MSFKRNIFSRLTRKKSRSKAQTLTDQARNNNAAMLKSLEKEEQQLANELFDICDDNGVEIQPEHSSKIFYKLGEIYHKRFINSSNLCEARFDCIKAAALYEASLQRGKEDSLCTMHVEVLYRDFLSLAGLSDTNTAVKIKHCRDDLKEELNDARNTLKDKLNIIDNPFHNKNPLDNVNSSKERLFQEDVEHLLFEGTEFFISFMKKIFDFSQSILGNPPCQFALLGLGSLARKEITLYSDFESIIVLDQKQDILNLSKCNDYFRNYTTLAFLIIVGLGETILPSVAIKSLNDFSGKGGRSFFDKFSKRGITFDGFMPHASKNPIGRLPTKEKPWATELIQPIDVMLRYITLESDKKEGYHLADVLLQSTFVTGDLFLAEVFRRKAWKRNQDKLKDPSTNCYEVVYAGLMENIKAFDYSDLNQGEKIHVKKDLYRGITILLPQLGVLTDIWKQSPFQLLEKLLNRKRLTSSTCHDLKTAVAIANYARLVTYMGRKGMSESVAVGRGHSRSSNVIEIFDVAEISALVRLYCIGIRIQQKVRQLVETKDISVLAQDFLKEGIEKGNILLRFEQYDYAIQFYELKLEILLHYHIIGKNDKVADLNFRIGKCYYYKNDIDNAYRYFVLADLDCLANTELHSKILQYLALCSLKKDQSKRAYEHLAKSLKIISELNSKTLIAYHSFGEVVDTFCEINGDKITPDLIEMNILTGDFFKNKSMFREAINKYEDALRKIKSYYGEGEGLNPQRGEICVLHNIAICQFNLGFYKSSAEISFKSIIETINTIKINTPTINPFVVLANGNKVSCLEYLKTVYDTFEKALNLNSDCEWATEQCQKVLDALDYKIFLEFNLTKRITIKLFFLIGELFSKLEKWNSAITYFKKAGLNYKKLYNKDHIVSIHLQAHCYHMLKEHLKSLRLYCAALSIRHLTCYIFHSDTFSMDLLTNALKKWNDCDTNDSFAQQVIVFTIKPLLKNNESQVPILTELDKIAYYSHFKMFFKACTKHRLHAIGVGILYQLVGVCCYNLLCAEAIYSAPELAKFLFMFLELPGTENNEAVLVTHSLIIETILYMSDNAPIIWKEDFDAFDVKLELQLECLKPKTKYSLYIFIGGNLVRRREFHLAIDLFKNVIKELIGINIHTPWTNKILSNLYEALANVQLTVGKTEEALLNLKRAIDIVQPEDKECRIFENPFLTKARINLVIYKIYLNQYDKEQAFTALICSINDFSQINYAVISDANLISTEFVINLCLLYNSIDIAKFIKGFCKAIKIWVKCNRYEDVHLLSASLLKIVDYKRCFDIFGCLFENQSVVVFYTVNVLYAIVQLTLEICHLVLPLGEPLRDNANFKHVLNKAVSCIFKVPKLFTSCTMAILIKQLHLVLACGLGKTISYLERSDVTKFLEINLENWHDRHLYIMSSTDFEVSTVFCLVAKLYEELEQFDHAIDCWEHILSFLDEHQPDFNSFDWLRKMLKVILNLSKCYLKSEQPHAALEGIFLFINLNKGAHKLKDLAKKLSVNVLDKADIRWSEIFGEMDKMYDLYNTNEKEVSVQWDFAPPIVSSKPLLTEYDLPVLMKLLYTNELKTNTIQKPQQHRYLPRFNSHNTTDQDSLNVLESGYISINYSEIYEELEEEQEEKEKCNENVVTQSRPFSLSPPPLPPKPVSEPNYVNFCEKPKSSPKIKEAYKKIHSATFS